MDRFGLCVREAAGADDGLDLFDGKSAHSFRSRPFCKEGGGDLVHAEVGTLSREKDGDQEGKGILVFKGNRGIREELIEGLLDHLPTQNLEKIALKRSSERLVPIRLPRWWRARRISEVIHSGERLEERP